MVEAIDDTKPLLFEMIRETNSWKFVIHCLTHQLRFDSIKLLKRQLELEFRGKTFEIKTSSGCIQGMIILNPFEFNDH